MARKNHHSDGSETPDEETIQVKHETLIDKDLSDEPSPPKMTMIKDEIPSRTNTPLSTTVRLKESHSSSASTPRAKSENEEVILKTESKTTNGRNSPDMDVMPSKKSARASKKGVPRVAPLFDDLPDATDEANSSYQVIDSCSYQNKYLGYTEHAMECDCSEEWGKQDSMLPWHAYETEDESLLIIRW